MELEGISKFCRTKVIMKGTMTSNSAKEVKNSTGVSFGPSSTAVSSSFTALLTTLFADSGIFFGANSALDLRQKGKSSNHRGHEKAQGKPVIAALPRPI